MWYHSIPPRPHSGHRPSAQQNTAPLPLPAPSAEPQSCPGHMRVASRRQPPRLHRNRSCWWTGIIDAQVVDRRQRCDVGSRRREKDRARIERRAGQWSSPWENPLRRRHSAAPVGGCPCEGDRLIRTDGQIIRRGGDRSFRRLIGRVIETWTKLAIEGTPALLTRNSM